MKFNYKAGEGYVFEAFTTKTVEMKKKAVRATYVPRIYVRTPEEELAELTGTVMYMEGKTIRGELKLDKVTKKPFIATGNVIWPRGYKTFFVLNSIEHEILNAHKYKNIKKFGFF